MGRKRPQRSCIFDWKQANVTRWTHRWWKRESMRITCWLLACDYITLRFFFLHKDGQTTKIFLILSKNFRNFVYYLPLCAYSLPKDAMCHVWMKLTQLFWRRRFFNFVNTFSLFCYCLPLGKDGFFSFEQICIFFTQECFVPSLVENGPVVLEKIFKSSQCVFTISQLSPL